MAQPVAHPQDQYQSSDLPGGVDEAEDVVEHKVASLAVGHKVESLAVAHGLWLLVDL